MHRCIKLHAEFQRFAHSGIHKLEPQGLSVYIVGMTRVNRAPTLVVCSDRTTLQPWTAIGTAEICRNAISAGDLT